MADENLNISRRSVLAGLGTIGVASAGAGIGTSAYFNDTEEFDGNTMTAGELDLLVHWKAAYNGKREYGPVSGTVDGEAAHVSLEDVKPGDSMWGEFCFEIVDNPAYLWLCGEQTADRENGRNEAERNHSDDDSGRDGELDDAIVAHVSYSDGHQNRRGPKGAIASGSLAEVLAALENGIPLDNRPDTDERDCFENAEGSNLAYSHVLVEMEVPASVGNEIQSDGLEFDLRFYAEQCRHNDGATNPCVESETGDGFGKLTFGDGEKSWFARAKHGKDGTAGDNELYLGDTLRNLADGQRSWSDSASTVTEPFELSYDAGTGEATWNVGDSGADAISYDVNDPATTGDGSADELSLQVRTSEGRSASVSDVRFNGYRPTGPTSVSASDGEDAYLKLSDVNTATDWSLTGSLTLDPAGADDGENVAVDVDVD